MTLAVTSYETLPTVAGDRTLNLAWTADERTYLALDLDALVARELSDEQRDLRSTRSYMVQDPYGEGALGDAVAAFYGRRGWSCRLVCGAGVNGLLHSLAGLVAGRCAYVIGDVYPDYPHWVMQAGGVCRARADAGLDVERHVAGVRDAGAAVVLVERPSLFDEGGGLGSLRALCQGAAACNAVVLVDESYGNYAPPAFSAVHLLEDVPNLIVLRGLSKGYSLGSLRLGYAVTSPSLAARVRDLVPPLAVASWSLRVGRVVLERGDLLAPLRERLSTTRAEAASLLASSGLVELMPSCEYAPFLLCYGDAAEIQRRLAERGVVGKRQPYWSESTGSVRYVCRLSVPLAPERMALLRQLVTS